MATVEIETIKQQSQKLLPDQKIELIKFLAESLAPQKSRLETEYMVYGKYRNSGRPSSSEEDFKIAEWNPDEAELNGD